MVTSLSGFEEAGGIVHATTVSVDGRGLLIVGVSGSGKSGLALELIALGAGLVSDDRTILGPSDIGRPVASAPDALHGLIEARGLGLLRVDPAPPAPVAAVLDLGSTETERLPARRLVRLCGCDITLLHKVETPHFPAALLAYLRGGRDDA